MKQNLKWKIPHTVFERRILCFSSYENRKSKVKLWWVGASERKKRAFFVAFNLFTVSRLLCFISMYSVLNTLSEYTYFYISKNITSYTFLLVLKIVESLQCILKNKYTFTSYQKTLFHIDYQPISINQNNIFSNILYI